MSGRIEFEFGPGCGRPRRARTGGPMRILILGDFANRGQGAAAADTPLGQRGKLQHVDAESLDRVMSRIRPGLPAIDGVPGADALKIESIADFHPDELCERVDVFREMCATRARLADPGTFEQTAAGLAASPSDRPATAPDTSSGAKSEDEGAMLEHLLGRPKTSPPPTAAGPAVDLSRFIEEAVGPYIVPGEHPDQQRVVEAFDDGASASLRNLLHAPAFRSLEATWLAVYWLLRSLETDELLRVYLLDVSMEELRADVGNGEAGLRSSELYATLIEGTAADDADDWSVLVGDYYFDDSASDCRLLEGLGSLAMATGAPLLAGAAPRLLEDGSAVSESWTALRRHPAAAWIGLSSPRILLRLPFGRQTREIERFGFEELPPETPHDAFLWGNPAFGCALLLGRAFAHRGWAMEPGDVLELEDLPSHAVEADGEWRMTPCAELWLADSAASRLLDCGIMPVVSQRGRNAARLVRFQSLAAPPAGLRGPWSSS